jgi:hypothetical protein
MYSASLRRFWHGNSLSLAYLAIFLLCLFAQAWTGWLSYNKELAGHHHALLAFSAYLRDSHFWQALGENWESEFLQMASYVLFTVFLFQRGSSESKDPDKAEAVDAVPETRSRKASAPWPVRRGGWVYALYRNSLTLAFVFLFLLSFATHAWAGAGLANTRGAMHGEAAITLAQYLASSEFWFESMQNWQSEFLSIFAMVVLSIFLRQKGSPESKPVAAPHSETH